MKKTRLFKALGFYLLGLCLAPASLAQIGARQTILPGDRPQPLPVELAFPFFVSVEADESYAITFQPAAEHYLYRHQFSITLRDAGNPPAELDYLVTPGKAHHDQFFGDVEVFFDPVTLRVHLPQALTPSSTLLIRFQGCAAWGFCYAPQLAAYELLPPAPP